MSIVEGWRYDFHSALRSLRKDVKFSIVAIGTLAVTIGGTIVMLALVHSVLLKPLPYTDPHRLVILSERDPRFPIARGRALRTADFIDWRTRNRSFESIALYRRLIYDVVIDAEPLRAEVWSVSPSFFSLLGAKIFIGRELAAEDEQSARPPAALLSYEFWQTRFHGNPNVLGKQLTIPRQPPVTVVGVLAPEFRAPLVGTMVATAQVGLGDTAALPLVWQAYQPSASELANRDRGGYTGIARLKPNVSIEMATADVARIAQQLAVEHPDSNAGLTAVVSPLIKEVTGEFESALWILLAAVVCVLMTGVGNLANLQIARNSVRARELLIRAALGASRARLVRQSLIEGVVLAAMGGLAGALAATASLQLLIPMLPAGFPRLYEIGIDQTVTVYLIVVCFGAGLLLGSIPSASVCRPRMLDALKDNYTTGTRRRTRLRRCLIAGETALAFVLLIGATLLLKSSWRLLTTPTGMDEANVWVTSISLPPKYRATEDQIRFFLRSLDAVRAYPGVDAAGLVNAPPLAGLEMMWPNVLPDGVTNAEQNGVTLSLRTVTPDYFRVFRIPLLQGRFFTDADTAEDARVAVLNESAARQLIPDGNVIGRTIASYGKKYSIVGVIADLKMRRLDMAASPQVYSSYVQEPAGSDLPVTMVIRTRNDEEDITLMIRNAIASLDPDVIPAISTMRQVRWQKTSTERFRTILLTLFAATALFLALMGVVGVVSYAVTQRTREIGIRMAIGADSRKVMALMMRQSMIPAALGLVGGTVASLWLSRFLAAFLYDVAPTDPATFAISIGLFAGSVVVASYLPARRAAHVDPSMTLRQ